MFKLFIYGMLQEENVIKNLLGRIPSMKVVHLKDHGLVSLYPDGVFVVAAIPLDGSFINGRVIEITDEELKVLDQFEGAYKRTEVTLTSGTKAQVYLKGI